MVPMSPTIQKSTQVLRAPMMCWTRARYGEWADLVHYARTHGGRGRLTPSLTPSFIRYSTRGSYRAIHVRCARSSIGWGGAMNQFELRLKKPGGEWMMMAPARWGRKRHRGEVLPLRRRRSLRGGDFVCFFFFFFLSFQIVTAVILVI